MPNSRIPSPARSQGAPITPRRHKPRASRSVGSPARSTASGRLSSIVDQFKETNRDSFPISPLSKTVLSDNTEIEMPRRKSWWRKVENSRDVIEVLENEKIVNPANVLEELDIEVLSQENKKYSLDLPDSSDNETINSIIVPQRKMFILKENQPQKNYGEVVDTKNNKHHIEDKTIDIRTKNLFHQAPKRSKPAFAAALLETPDKTLANKTKELEVKTQTKGLFGNAQGTKRKNVFAECFFVSESEDEIPEIQPKMFAFHKKSEPPRRSSATSRGVREPSPGSSITTDIEMDDWKLLPSSTMMENQLETNLTPGKKARLSKLSEAKESTNTDITKQSIKSGSSKNKSKIILSPTKNQTTNQDIPDTANENAKEISNVKNKTYNISKTITKQLSNSQYITCNEKEKAEQEQASQKNSIHTEPEPSPEQQDEEMVLTYDDNESEENDKQTKIPIDDKTKTICVDDKLSKVSEYMDDIEIELSKIVDGEEQQLETPILNKSVHLTSKVVEETPDSKIEVNIAQCEDTANSNTLSNIPERVVDQTEKQDLNKIFCFQENENNVKIFDAEHDEQEKGAQKNINENPENNQQEQANIDNLDGEEDVPTDEDKAEASQEIEASDQEETEAEQELEEDEEHEQNKPEDMENKNKSQNVIEKSENQGIKADYPPNDDENESQSDNEQNEEQDEETDTEETEASDKDDNKNGSQEIEVEEQDDNVETEEERDDKSEIEEEEQSEKEDEENESSENEVQDESQQMELEEQDDEQHESLEQNEDETEEDDDQDEAVEPSEAKELEVEEQDDEQYESLEQNEDETEEDDDQDEAVEPSEAKELEVEEQDDEQHESLEQNEDETEEDDDQDEAVEPSEENQEEDQSEDQHENPQQSEIEPDGNVTHDTTGRNRKKRETNAPEAILNNVENEMDSFTAQGRNTSIRKTKSIFNNEVTLRPSLAPTRESTGLSDGTRNSSAEGSGWDSHRTTRKTLRQTFGKDFTPRKSLRTLVIEKSAKRRTAINEANAGLNLPQANSTTLPDIQDDQMNFEDNVQVSEHEISKRTRQTMLDMYLQKIKKENMEIKQKIELQIKNSLKSGQPKIDIFNFKVPNKPAIRRAKTTSLQTAPKPKRVKPTLISLENLPPEFVEDMKYKPPKRFRPSNASWITKRLYKFLETKLEPKYDYKARNRAEKLVETIYNFVRDIKKLKLAPPQAVTKLEREMAHLDIVQTHFDFYNFINDYMPVEVKIKVVPDIVNDLPLPREGLFAPILCDVDM